MSFSDVLGSIIGILILLMPFLALYWIIKKVRKRNPNRLIDEHKRLSDEIKEKQMELKLIQSKLEECEKESELLELGVYSPMFHFENSEQYRYKILEIAERQKNLIKSGRACICSTTWTVGAGKDSVKKGEQMTRDNINLALRAFNGECNGLISTVNSRNIGKIENKIRNAYEVINKLNARSDISLQPDYLELKIQELKVNYEYAMKKEAERQEQARIKEEMREEAKAQREREKAIADAERAQRDAEKELENARKLLEKDQQNEALQARLAELEVQYQEALARSERAISQAQLTKSGYVYVISNIGSFGENVFKIGMTRRLEPLDRVRELGDASVPFSFDVHAMIYSEDAPALESELHKVFASCQVNRVNPRKEFFKVPLEKIAEEVKKRNANIEFTMLAEASEYLQSLAMEKENKYIDIVETVEDEYEDET